MKGPKRLRIFLGRALYVESRVIYQYLMGEPFFCQLSGESGVDLGKHIANISAAAVTVRYRQISERISRNRRLVYG